MSVFSDHFQCLSTIFSTLLVHFLSYRFCLVKHTMPEQHVGAVGVMVISSSASSIWCDLGKSFARLF